MFSSEGTIGIMSVINHSAAVTRIPGGEGLSAFGFGNVEFQGDTQTHD